MCVTYLQSAMKCTIESPEQRMNAKEIVTGLSKIRDSLLRNVEAERMKLIFFIFYLAVVMNPYLYSE